MPAEGCICIGNKATAHPYRDRRRPSIPVRRALFSQPLQFDERTILRRSSSAPERYLEIGEEGKGPVIRAYLRLASACARPRLRLAGAGRKLLCATLPDDSTR